MPDDPFAGMGIDRTVMMPAPGGLAAPAARPPAGDQTEALEAPTATGGLNPLVAAANPLLNLIPPLRASASHPNPVALRDSLAQAVRRFEAQARAAGIPSEKIIAARYVLCTLIDETATSTPWGASGAWAQHGLLALFHGEVEGGEKSFQLLARLAENPQANLDLLELMYVCLQLGFEGRYRIVEGGQRQLEAIRQRVLSIIRRQRGEYERDLSPSWRGAPVAAPRLGWLPLWAVGAVTGLLLLAIYLGFAFSLTGTSDRLASEIGGVRVASARPVVPPRPAPEPRMAPFLAEETRAGLVAVDDRTDRSVVTILGDGLFKPGEAAVSAGDQTLIQRIGQELTKVTGQIEVIGHTDNVPIRTLRFPSNWELSRARAESVARLLATRVPAGRIRADGRGDADPIAPNDTGAGRARNRRVEITVYTSSGATSAGAPAGAPAAAGPPPSAPAKR
jgi:type VI secretion system protein ImpK